MKILVVEDNPVLQRQLVRALKDQSFTVDATGDGLEALFQIQNGSYDLVILDIMLPQMDGLEILQKIRKDQKTPVLLLTARDTVDDRIKGLDYGADDYLTKPFELDELLARVRSVIRRSQSVTRPVIVSGEVEIDTNSGKVVKNAPDLLDSVLDENDDTLSNSLTVHIFNVRKKLGKLFIQTVRGRGYLVE